MQCRFCVLIAVLISHSAAAATFCVSNATQLAQALLAAESNAQDDSIELVAGTYLLSNELDYFADASETYRLAIVGGFTPGCASSSASADATVLDGQNMTRMFMINARGEVDIWRITFAHGKPTQYFGAAINLYSSGDIYIYSNEFVANETPSGAAGALYVSSEAGHSVYVWSNLFLANTSSGGAIYAGNSGNLYITGNTVLANSVLNHSGLTGGIDLAGTGHSWLTNNILWNNENVDVYDQGGHADYANNDIGVHSGFAPLSESNDLNVDPGFSGFLSVRPGPASPLINAGLDSAPGGVGGCCDASGAPRVIGKHVDIGAYESDVLFRNGFDG